MHIIRNNNTTHQAKNNMVLDHELQYLVTISGLKESHIAEQNGITPQYFSMLKLSERKAVATRLKIKLWLINYIRHFLNFKLAA